MLNFKDIALYTILSSQMLFKRSTLLELLSSFLVIATLRLFEVFHYAISFNRVDRVN